jgi:hypothetical protein
MRRSLVALSLVAAAGLAWGALASGQDAGAFKSEVAGLRIGWEPYGSDHDMQPFGDGTLIEILVKGEGLVGADAAASKILVAKDDKEGDLTKVSGWNKPEIGNTPQCSKDNKAVLVQLKLPKPPTRGSKSIHVEAEIALITANGTEKKEGSVTFEKDAKVEFGTEPLVVSEVRDSGWAEMPLTVTLKGTKPLHWLADFSLKDDAGAEVKCRSGGRGWEGFGGKFTYNQMLQLGKKLTKGTLVLEVRKDMKTVTVPVALDVAIGG